MAAIFEAECGALLIVHAAQCWMHVAVPSGEQLALARYVKTFAMHCDDGDVQQRGVATQCVANFQYF
jgi:hypothetical protein